MQSIAADVAHNVSVCVCRCVGHTDVLCKTLEPIEMPLVMGVKIPRGMGNFGDTSSQF